MKKIHYIFLSTFLACTAFWGCSDKNDNLPIADSVKLTGLPESGVIELLEGQTYTVGSVVTPDNVGVSYFSGNTSVFTVDETGKITAMTLSEDKRIGQATLYAVSHGLDNKKSQCEVVVTVPIRGIEVDNLNGGVFEYNVLNRRTITVDITPKNATNTELTYVSSDPAIFTVNPKTGEILPVAKGEANLIIRTNDGSDFEKECKVRVPGAINFPYLSIVLSKNETLDLASVITTSPSSIAISDLIYTSELSTVASVDNQGLVTGVATGVTTVTVKDKNNIAIKKLKVLIAGEENLIRTNWIASASTIYGSSYAAPLAIDGNRSSMWISTETGIFPQWLLLDMKENIPITKIKVNRRNSPSYQDSKVVDIYVSNSELDGISQDDLSFEKVGTVDFGAGATGIFDLDLNLSTIKEARYIKLNCLDSNRKGVSIAEVDVVCKISK